MRIRSYAGEAWLGSHGCVRRTDLSAVEHGRNEVGAQVLLAIGREFNKSLEWSFTGQE